MTCNEPNATTPPTYATTNYGKFWTFVKGGYSTNSYDTYSQCPSGWTLMDPGDCTYFISGKRIALGTSSLTEYSFSSTTDKNNARAIFGDEWSALKARNALVHINTGNSFYYGCQGSNLTVRCWRQYNDSTDR